MARPFLTVLTAPIPSPTCRLYQGVRRALRPLLKPGVPLPETSPYPGHYGVVRSVVVGLRAIGADFNFNPRRLSDLARVVYAPANEALRQAAALKRQGAIDYLVAGPVNALFADECDGILLMPEIDRLIVAHEWQAEFVRGVPEVLAKCRPCPCGVDADWWTPTGPRDTAEALVYWKSGDEAFCCQVEDIVRACGLDPRRVRALPGEHAMYSRVDYRRLLNRAAIGVFLSAFETQGLALAEAWSMDVPTLVWDPRGDRPSVAHARRARTRAAPRADRAAGLCPAPMGARPHDGRDLFRGARRDHPRGCGGPPVGGVTTMVRRSARELRRWWRAIRNPGRVAALQHGKNLRVHLGCGDDRIPGFVNIDARATAAVDVVMDLSLPLLTAGSVSLAFSNAFFEHLYRESRTPHLQRVRQALAPDGACCYIGIPYFRNIARLYVERGPGTVSPVFDLYNVYRYTHGDPEGQAAWWLGQLHKSLFDEDEVAGLLSDSGFGSYEMFCYGYPGDVNEVPVTMGFYATRASAPAADLRRRCVSLLEQFSDTRLRLETLTWLAPPP